MPNDTVEIEKKAVAVSTKKVTVEMSEAMVMLPLLQFYNDFQLTKDRGNIIGAANLAGMVEGLAAQALTYNLPCKKNVVREMLDTIYKFYTYYKITRLDTNSATDPEDVVEALRKEGVSEEELKKYEITTVAEAMQLAPEVEAEQDDGPEPVSKLLH